MNCTQPSAALTRSSPSPEGVFGAFIERVQTMAASLRVTNNELGYTRDRVLGGPPAEPSSQPADNAGGSAAALLAGALNEMELEIGRAENLVGSFARL